MLEDQILEDVLNQYALDVIHVDCINDKGKKAVWHIASTAGSYFLKKVSCSEPTLRFIISGIKYLVEKEIRLPTIIVNKSGEDYTKTAEGLFVLSEEINGTKLRDLEQEDRQLIVTELGHFHHEALGYVPPGDAKPKNHLGTWGNEYNSYLENLNLVYNQRMYASPSTAVDKVIVKEFPYFYRRAKRAIEGLMGREYREWVIKIARSGSLCHQDFSSANLLNTKNGLYILDTDSLTVDLPARDIRKLMNKTMKKTRKWNVDQVTDFIGWYDSKNKLSADEWKVVFYDLMFPHLYLGAVHKYFYQRDKTWNEEDYLNRINEMSAFEKTINPVLAGFHIAGREL